MDFPVALLQSPVEIISDIMPRAEPHKWLEHFDSLKSNPEFTKRKCNNDPVQLKLLN